MRASILIMLLLALMMTASSEASDREIYLQQLPGQKVTYADGIGWVSTGRDVILTVSIRPEGRKRAWVSLVVSNNSSQSVTISERQVSASVSGAQLKTFSASELLQAEQRRQTWQKFGAGLAMGLNSYAASQQGNYNTNGRFSGAYNQYGTNGYQQGNVSGTFSVQGRDPTAAAIAQQNATATNLALAERLQQQQASQMATLENRLLRAQTLQPGAWHGGEVAIELPGRSRQSQPLAIEVFLAGSKRSFLAFLDAPPTEAQLAMVKQLPAHPDDVAVASTPTPPSPQEPRNYVALPAATSASTPSNAIKSDTVRDSPAPSPTPAEVDPRAKAAAQLLATEVIAAAAQAFAPFLNEIEANLAKEGSPEAQKLLNAIRDRPRAEKALARIADGYARESGAIAMLEEVFTKNMTYDDMVDTATFLRTPAGRSVAAILVDPSRFDHMSSSLKELDDKRSEEILRAAVASVFPEIDLDQLLSRVDK